MRWWTTQIYAFRGLLSTCSRVHMCQNLCFFLPSLCTILQMRASSLASRRPCFHPATTEKHRSPKHHCTTTNPLNKWENERDKTCNNRAANGREDKCLSTTAYPPETGKRVIYDLLVEIAKVHNHPPPAAAAVDYTWPNIGGGKSIQTSARHVLIWHTASRQWRQSQDAFVPPEDKEGHHRGKRRCVAAAEQAKAGSFQRYARHSPDKASNNGPHPFKSTRGKVEKLHKKKTTTHKYEMQVFSSLRSFPRGTLYTRASTAYGRTLWFSVRGHLVERRCNMHPSTPHPSFILSEYRPTIPCSQINPSTRESKNSVRTKGRAILK